MIGYLGIMNDQDNVEVFIDMARVIRYDLERHDIAFVMVGAGDAYGRLVRMRDGLGLGESVAMPGKLPWEDVLSVLAATDICVQPDLPTEFNCKSTMNKLMEYMALGRACVAFDMTETRISGGDAAVYVTRFDAIGLADAVVDLADQPELCSRLGALGRRRIETTLAWEHQEHNLLAVYGQLGAGRRRR